MAKHLRKRASLLVHGFEQGNAMAARHGKQYVKYLDMPTVPEAPSKLLSMLKDFAESGVPLWGQDGRSNFFL